MCTQSSIVNGAPGESNVCVNNLRCGEVNAVYTDANAKEYRENVHVTTRGCGMQIFISFSRI